MTLQLVPQVTLVPGPQTGARSWITTFCALGAEILGPALWLLLPVPHGRSAGTEVASGEQVRARSPEQTYQSLRDEFANAGRGAHAPRLDAVV